MKKLYTLIASAFMIALCGCAGTTPAAEAGVKIEKEAATYKMAAYVNVDEAKAKLASAGFEVVGTYKAYENGTTVLFTNSAMKAMANKPTRGLAAVGRLLVDDDRKQISIANPVYFGKAFMQKEYSHATASAELAALEKAFGPLSNSADKWEFEA